MTRPEEKTGASHTTATILIVEDEELIRISLASRLTKCGYRVIEAEDGQAGLDAVDETFVDLVLLDYKLPDIDGLEVLRRLQERSAPPVTIMMTAFSSIEGVVEAMQNGAYTYVKKPFELEEMLEHITRGLETTSLRREVARLRREAEQAHGATDDFVRRSEAMGTLDDLITRMNDVGSSTVLVTGESGTGKNVIAKRLHLTSARADSPFMTITCTDFSENLLESELFGHQKGAFTGADSTKPGLLELANGGTVFLDEIGDMPMPLQAKLLRFLEERKFRRVGGTAEIEVDVRVIAATNSDLEAMVEAKSFRRDLFYRLSVIPLELPPLRERVEDIRELAALFVERFAQEFRKSVNSISPEALKALEQHDWPGNIRELRNVLERATLLCRTDRVEVSDLPRSFQDISSDAGDDVAARILGPGGLDLEELERSLIKRALELEGGNQSAAARLLCMSRDQIRYRIEKFGL